MNSVKIKCITVLAAVFLPLFIVTAAEAADDDKLLILDNGLKVYLRGGSNLPLVHMVLAVNAGSKDETRETNGLLHLLEHLMLLGSTEFREAKQLVEYIRSRGVYLNAHTSHDMLFMEVTAPSHQAAGALQLLKEKIFYLKWSLEELNKEKKVILEELSQARDDPGQLGLNLALQALFEGHPYGNSTGGRGEVIKKATLEQLKGFHRTYVFPANCSLAVMGDIEPETLAAEVKRLYEPLTNPNPAPAPASPVPAVPPLAKTVEIQRELDINRAYLYIGFPAPGLNHPDKLPLDVLSQIIGKGVNPLLYSALAERRLVENVGVNYIRMKHAGAFVVRLEMEPKRLRTARARALRFLNGTRRIRYSKADYSEKNNPYIRDHLELAKTWMEMSYQQYRERGLNLTRGYAGHLLTHEESSGKSRSERLDEMTSGDLKKIAHRYLGVKKYVTVAIVPQKKK